MSHLFNLPCSLLKHRLHVIGSCVYRRGITSADHKINTQPKLSFYLEAGYALFAKRPARAFPASFLGTDRRLQFDGDVIQGMSNGDDAIIVGEHFIATGDGVGQWATRDKGHAALWSRLILHFWDAELRRDVQTRLGDSDPVACLQRAYDQTVAATSKPEEWHGTTTVCGAYLPPQDTAHTSSPVVYVINLGDSQCLLLRRKEGGKGETVYKSSEQWHWFDCPRQLGTNSPDSPTGNAVLDKLDIQHNDIILTMSDGVVDNLWEHEIVANVFASVDKFAAEHASSTVRKKFAPDSEMTFVAEELLKATRAIAEDPYAESPFMERAVEEGLALEGGKLDDISIVAARCCKKAA